jgi:hypothetical protein
MTVKPEPPPQVEVGRDGFSPEARFQAVPVVRGPDVSGRVNGHVGDHLDAAALEDVDDMPLWVESASVAAPGAIQ